MYETLLEGNSEYIPDVSVVLTLARRRPNNGPPHATLLFPDNTNPLSSTNFDLHVPLYTLARYYTFPFGSAHHTSRDILDENLRRLGDHSAIRFLPPRTSDPVVSNIMRKALPTSPKSEYRALIAYLHVYLSQGFSFAWHNDIPLLFRARRTINILRENMNVLEVTRARSSGPFEQYRAFSQSLFGLGDDGSVLKVFLGKLVNSSDILPIYTNEVDPILVYTAV